jgi:Flp pilus assembly protein TadD
VALLREAAGLYRGSLSDPARAVELLEQAQKLKPDDIELQRELAAARDAAGDR